PGAVRARPPDSRGVPPSDPVFRARRRRQHPREHDAEPGRSRRDRAVGRCRARAVHRRGRARWIDQRRTWHRLREGALPAARTLGRRDRADEARETGLRSPGDPQSRQGVSRLITWAVTMSETMLKLSTVAVVALLSLSGPQTQTDEIAALKKEIEALKAN